MEGLLALDVIWDIWEGVRTRPPAHRRPPYARTLCHVPLRRICRRPKAMGASR